MIALACILRSVVTAEGWEQGFVFFLGSHLMQDDETHKDI